MEEEEEEELSRWRDSGDFVNSNACLTWSPSAKSLKDAETGLMAKSSGKQYFLMEEKGGVQMVSIQSEQRPTLAPHIQYLRQFTDLDLPDCFGLVWGCLELHANSFVIGTAVINTLSGWSRVAFGLTLLRCYLYGRRSRGIEGERPTIEAQETYY